MKLLRQSLGLLACATFLALPALARAAYPDKPIKIVLPFPAGGTVDVVTRLVAAEMSEILGKAVVVDYRPGAGGMLASEAVVKAAPDGYTILVTTPSHTINPALRPKMAFDTEADLLPVSMMANVPELLVAHPSAPFNSVPELIAYAKANPGSINYSSAGNGTLPHITMELLSRRAGIKLTHIPYKGAAPALNDLIGGTVMLKYDTYATSAQLITAQKIKVLATAGTSRLAQLPHVPTVAEAGFAGYAGYLWIGALVPKGTPPDVIATLSTAIAKAVRSPKLLERFRADGVEAAAEGPVSFSRLINEEIKQWTRIVREANITAAD